jgi:hypothetical protein
VVECGGLETPKKALRQISMCTSTPKSRFW